MECLLAVSVYFAAHGRSCVETAWVASGLACNQAAALGVAIVEYDWIRFVLYAVDGSFYLLRILVCGSDLAGNHRCRSFAHAAVRQNDSGKKSAVCGMYSVWYLSAADGTFV